MRMLRLYRACTAQIIVPTQPAVVPFLLQRNLTVTVVAVEANGLHNSQILYKRGVVAMVIWEIQNHRATSVYVCAGLICCTRRCRRLLLAIPHLAEAIEPRHGLPLD